MATFIFFPEGAYGPTNNCVGIGDVLRARGHRVVFVVEESFAGTLEAKGFEERLMRLGPTPEVEEAPGQFWKDFIRETAPVFRKPTIEQLEDFIAPTWQALLDGARYVDERLVEIFDEVQPDVICEDNVRLLPGHPRERPAVGAHRLLQPARGEGPRPAADVLRLPAATTAAAGTRSAPSTAAPTARCTRDFDAFVPGARRAAAARLEFIHESPWLNLYVYPAEADYARSRPLAPTWHRLESCVRATDGAFELPESCAPATARSSTSSSARSARPTST